MSRKVSHKVILSSLSFCILFLFLPFYTGAGAAVSQEPSALAAIQLEPMLTGLSSPVLVTHAGDGSNRLFIVEQTGIIKVLQPGATTPTEFLNITTRVQSGGERGLLGLAFHPQYETNRRFFVYYTRLTDSANVVAEYRVSASNPDVADTTETVLLPMPDPFSNHNGGMLAFGQDGYLYIATGDGGSANDPGNRAQNINDLLGKILRINVDQGTPYSSPSSNPFFGATAGRDEIYAYGLRNPWRFSFDRSTGQLYAGDVGQGQREEIDIITLGGNYGWRVFEGTLCTNLDTPLCATLQQVPPITEYSHSGGRCSVTGGYVYRGPIATLPTGSYVFADFCTGEIFLYQGGSHSLLLDTAINVSAFGEDEAGELYVVGLGGTVHRIVNPMAPCAYAITPTNKSFLSTGGSASIVVTTPAGCNWTAMSNDSFIQITSGSSGTGRGVVTFRVDPITDSTPRMGTLTIAGQMFTVMQTTDGDSDGIPDGVELQEGRDPLVKDNDIFNIARLFAMQQYRDFLGREGDAPGINFWTNQINSGAMTRAQVIDTFFGSTEFQQITPVTRLYFAYFLRIPDYGGLQFWVNQFRQGQTLSAISDTFAQSSEFQATYGSLTNEEFVTLVYDNVLDRQPDPGGFNFWVGQLNSGAMTRGQVMLEFSESNEYKGLIGNEVYVVQIYVGMLKRSPEQAGFNFWVGQLDGGSSGLDLINLFLTTPEYHNRFLPPL